MFIFAQPNPLFVPQYLSMPKEELICNQYKKQDRVFTWYRGFRLANVKIIAEYSFAGFIIKVEQNNHELRFDIYLRKHGIDTTEVEKFRKFWGKGFKIILLEVSEEDN